MTDQPRIDALDELGRRFDAALAAAPRRRRGRVAVAVAAAAAALATPAVAVVTDGFDFGRDVPRPGTPGGPPLPVTGRPPERTLDVLALAGSDAGRAELRRRLAAVGIGLRVTAAPVGPSRVGIVLGVQFPRRARFQGRQLVLERGVGGTVIVAVGAPPRAGQTARLTIAEALPEVPAAVDRDDAAGTARRLRALGFTVRVRLVVDNPARATDPLATPTGVKAVADPPPGTVVLQVTNADGGATGRPGMRVLVLEVAPRGSAVASAHP